MGYTESLGESLAIVGAFAPRVVATAAQTIYTDVVDMSHYRRGWCCRGQRPGRHFAGQGPDGQVDGLRCLGHCGGHRFLTHPA
jgi:hypothetical protein